MNEREARLLREIEGYEKILARLRRHDAWGLRGLVRDIERLRDARKAALQCGGGCALPPHLARYADVRLK